MLFAIFDNYKYTINIHIQSFEWNNLKKIFSCNTVGWLLVLYG